MIALPRHGFVMLSMPKCASTTIVRSLSAKADVIMSGHPKLKHLNCRQFHQRMVPLLRYAGFRRRDYELVSLFREPIEWLESWWRYRSRPAMVEENPLLYTGGLTFEQFAAGYVAGDTDVTGRVGRPARFVAMSDELDIGVDRIFALDRPDTWQAWLEERMGEPLGLRTANVSSVRREPELTTSTRQALTDFFRPEYEIHERLRDSGVWTPRMGHVPGR